jgi:hypothetical protein
LEFDESKLVCNTSAAFCRCRFKVLDLLACADRAEAAESHDFDLTISSKIQNLSSNGFAYTAECHTAVWQQGACILKGINDIGFHITSWEAVFAALSVFFELLSIYQIVS